jgi:hypothetical protein
MTQPVKCLLEMPGIQGGTVHADDCNMAMALKRLLCRQSHALTQVLSLLQIDWYCVFDRELCPQGIVNIRCHPKFHVEAGLMCDPVDQSL